MSPVEFKKMLCRPVEFKGQGPLNWLVYRNQMERPNGGADIQSTLNTIHSMCEGQDFHGNSWALLKDLVKMILIS